MTIAEKGIAPAAMLFANHIDSLAACGLLMADNWLEKRIITVDLLGQEFLDAVKTGQTMNVKSDGTVELENQTTDERTPHKENNNDRLG